MKILYLGNHGNALRSNDDEGAIARSLVELGCQLKLIQEHKFLDDDYSKYDFLLFHHYKDLNQLSNVTIPKVFWCFDRIDSSDDITLNYRTKKRTEWANEAIRISQLGFFTDGDWVARHQTDTKYIWLTQGLNQYLQRFPYESHTERRGILFTGGLKGGVVRDSFVTEMKTSYPQFIHVQGGYHGQRLAQLLSSVAICVAPDYPVSDSYWSNRIYLTLGLGGFLLHPYSQGLAEDFIPGHDLEMYCDRDELHEQIRHYLENVEEREILRERGHQQVLAHHTYKHRCETMLSIIKERVRL